MAAIHLILNHGSGGNQRGLDAGEVCDLVKKAFAAAGKEITCAVVEPQEIGRALEEVVLQRPEQVIVAGGDGTVATAAHYLGGTGIALGVLPMGTFNLAARDLGVPLEMEKAAEFLATADMTTIDVLEVNGHTCLCTMILGFYPQFSKTLERRDHGGRWWRKTWKLVTGLPDYFRRARSLDLEWRTAERGGRVRTKFSAFVPGRYRQSVGVVPEREGFRTGLLTAYLGSHRSPKQAMKAAVDFIAGRHESNDGLEVIEGKAMELVLKGRPSCKAMIDGEILTLTSPMRLEIRPGHLTVLAATTLGSR